MSKWCTAVSAIRWSSIQPFFSYTGVSVGTPCRLSRIDRPVAWSIQVSRPSEQWKSPAGATDEWTLRAETRSKDSCRDARTWT
jgi:hypothetical protein